MFRCSDCGSTNTYCISTRTRDDGTVWRRRICSECGYRFSTTERYVPNELIVKYGNVKDAGREAIAKDLCSGRR